MLSESLLQALRLLRLSARRSQAGAVAGARQSIQRGRSLEFADYRTYTPGDDPRRVDWNAFARLERPFIKLFEDERDLPVFILLDDSPSMFWREEGELPAQHGAKWRCATQLAAALAFVALVGGDPLTLETHSGQRLSAKRGVAAFPSVVEFIRRLEPKPIKTALNAWGVRFAQRARSGICILISDFLDEQGPAEGIAALAATRQLYALHVLSTEELSPSLSDEVLLRDVETGQTRALSVDPALLAEYARQLETWRGAIEREVHRRGGRYLLADASKPIREILLRDMRQAGWLV
ncbi:MAG: DUF58 domain-containing protein [Thermoflexales bacterium]|nr:DUF58 domain-containing protein [Thermoflexales bacterium]